MRTAVLFLALFSAGLGVSRSLAHSEPGVPAVTPQAEAAPAPSGPSDCSGGPEASLQVDLVPQAIERSNGSDVLTVSPRLRHVGEGAASLRYSVEVVSDVGESVLRAPELTGRLARAGELPARALQTPRGLGDGFYQVKVSATSQNEVDGEVEQSAHLYFSVRRGELTLMEADDWYARSRINEGVAR